MGTAMTAVSQTAFTMSYDNEVHRKLHSLCDKVRRSQSSTYSLRYVHMCTSVCYEPHSRRYFRMPFSLFWVQICTLQTIPNSIYGEVPLPRTITGYSLPGLGHHAVCVHDPGTNFGAKELRNWARGVGGDHSRTKYRPTPCNFIFWNKVSSVLVLFGPSSYAGSQPGDQALLARAPKTVPQLIYVRT